MLSAIGLTLHQRQKSTYLLAVVFLTSSMAQAGPIGQRDNPKAPTTVVSCIDAPPWNERFQYAGRLLVAQKYREADTLVIPALSDQCLSTRHRALELLQRAIVEERAPNRVEAVLSAAILKLKDVFTVVAWFALAWVGLAAVSTLSGWLNRRSIAVQPLTVSNGSGFDGQHFVSIAQAVNYQLQLLQTGPGGLPSQSATLPKMILDSVTFADKVLGVLQDDRTGKILSAVYAIWRNPRYTCSGSVHFAGRSTHIVLRLQKGNKIIEVWERYSQAAAIIDDLKDLSYSGLQAARSNLRPRVT